MGRTKSVDLLHHDRGLHDRRVLLRHDRRDLIRHDRHEHNSHDSHEDINNKK